jgi:hypothetical protein
LKSEKWKDEEEWRVLQSLENGKRLEKDGIAILDDERQPYLPFHVAAVLHYRSYLWQSYVSGE